MFLVSHGLSFVAVPSHIKEVLVMRYEYIVAEKEVVPDLTASLRLCETCGEWCAQCVIRS